MVQEKEPITVQGDNLEIEASLLEVGKDYPFEYLGGSLLARKQPDGTVDLYQVQ